MILKTFGHLFLNNYQLSASLAKVTIDVIAETSIRTTLIMPQISFGSRVRKSPYFSSTQKWGCKAYSVYNHTYMPLYYDSAEADYNALINDVSLWDVACERQVEVTGPDAFAFTQYLTPRNLSKQQVGQAKYVPLVDENGGIINDPVLLRLETKRFWFSIADNDVLLWAKGVANHAGFDVNVQELDVAPLQVQGPKASLLMQKLCGDWILDLKYFWFKSAEINGIKFILSRTGWSNERGYELFLIDTSRGDELWELIMSAGREFNIKPGAPSHIKRMEAGLLSYWNDMDITNNPFEVGLGKFCDTNQEANFVGKDALTKIQSEGVRRKIMGAEIDGIPIGVNEHHWPVSALENVATPKLESDISNVPWANLRVAYILQVSKKI